MPGTSENTIHFILMGNALEHVLCAIKHYGIREMVVFTSEDLYDENMAFIRELGEQGIIVHEVVKLRPFEDDALRCMARMMLQAHLRYSSQGNINIIAALTGGTNLMVAAMTTYALLKGVRCHYIVKEPENRVIDITLLEELHALGTLQAIEDDLAGDKS